MEALTNMSSNFWVDLLAIAIPVFAAFFIGYFFATLAARALNKRLRKRNAELKSSNDELGQTIKKKDLRLRSMQTEMQKTKAIQPIVTKQEEPSVDVIKMMEDNDRYREANTALMLDNMKKEKELLQLKEHYNKLKQINTDQPASEPQSASAKEISPVKKVDMIYELNKIVGEKIKRKKDDLTQIMGIGSGLEIKLNSFGIFNFEQIARLNDRGIELLNGLTGLSSSKIKDNRWVQQAKNLL